MMQKKAISRAQRLFVIPRAAFHSSKPANVEVS